MIALCMSACKVRERMIGVRILGDVRDVRDVRDDDLATL